MCSHAFMCADRARPPGLGQSKSVKLVNWTREVSQRLLEVSAKIPPKAPHSLCHRTMPAIGGLARTRCDERGFVAQVHRGRDHEVPAQKGGQCHPENHLQLVSAGHAASFRIGNGGARARQ